MLRLADEFRLQVVLDHASDADLVSDEIKAAGVPVVYGPLFVPRDVMGRRRRSATVAVRLIERDVKVAMMTDHPVAPMRYLRLEVGLLIREGLDWQKAMQTVTSCSADILGVSHQVGRLGPGLDADLIEWAGDPWQPSAHVSMVMVNGRAVQTR